MYNEPEEMKELHRIREQHYYETKGMTIEARLEMMHRNVEVIIKKNGFKFQDLKTLAKK